MPNFNKVFLNKCWNGLKQVGNLFRSSVVVVCDLPTKVIKLLIKRSTQFDLMNFARLLFYATFGELQYTRQSGPETSTLWVSDLAGYNATKLISFPTINEIRGMAIDYHHNDRQVRLVYIVYLLLKIFIMAS